MEQIIIYLIVNMILMTIQDLKIELIIGLRITLNA